VHGGLKQFKMVHSAVPLVQMQESQVDTFQDSPSRWAFPFWSKQPLGGQIWQHSPAGMYELLQEGLIQSSTVQLTIPELQTQV